MVWGRAWLLARRFVYWVSSRSSKCRANHLGALEMARRNSQAAVLPGVTSAPARASARPGDDDAEIAGWLAERARRVALGLAAALITARAYWPGEADLKAEVSSGLGWVAGVLIATAF